MKDLVIFGAGGMGREIAQLVEDINAIEKTWNFLGFIDDTTNGPTPEGYPVLGNLEYLLAMENKPYVSVCIANSHLREMIVKKCEAAGCKFATIIHPSVRIKSKQCTIGEGTILCSDVELGINTHVGKFCFLNAACGLGHDAVLDDYVSMMSHTITGGDIHVASHCYFGLRCTIINKIDITSDCTFGACAVVVKDATEPGTYVGVPARLIKKLAVREDA